MIDWFMGGAIAAWRQAMPKDLQVRPRSEQCQTVRSIRAKV